MASFKESIFAPFKPFSSIDTSWAIVSLVISSSTLLSIILLASNILLYFSIPLASALAALSIPLAIVLPTFAAVLPNNWPDTVSTPTFTFGLFLSIFFY